MESVVLKFLINYGVLGIVAFFYFYNNKKREEATKKREDSNQKIFENIINKALNSRICPEDESVITVNRVLVDQLTSYENKNVKEHQELKNILGEIKTDLADLFVLYKQGESSEQKTKHYKAVIREKISEELSLTGGDENLKSFIFEYCSTFSDWLMDSMNYLFENENISDPEFVYEKLRANNKILKDKCKNLIEPNLCIQFFECKEKYLNQFIDDITELVNEPTNDKKNRFFSMSILFMQKNLSKMIILWYKNVNKKLVYDNNIDGLAELRKLEKAKGKENE